MDEIKKGIKTFEDAYNELGINHKFVEDYSRCACSVSKDIEAYLKLRIICAALNEGWEPQFTNDEYRYYPYLILYTKEDVEGMDEETKNERGLFGGNANNGSSCGPVAANAHFDFGHAYATLGSRLCLRTRELAVYCGRQFIDLWYDLYVGK